MQCGLDPEGWAHRLAKEEAYQQECEAQEGDYEDVHFEQGNQERTAEIYKIPGLVGNE